MIPSFAFRERWGWYKYTRGGVRSRCGHEDAQYLELFATMSSSSSGNSISWPYAAASILAGVGAGYALGVASSRWLFSGENAQVRTNPGVSSPQRQQVPGGAASGNLVAALVELTAEVGTFISMCAGCMSLVKLPPSPLPVPQVARLRQSVETGGLFSRLPGPSRRSMRGGGSTADFVSAQGDNTESDDEFFEPK